MKPYFEEDGITIYHGDCRELMWDLEFDVIVCDPPYALQRVDVIGDDNLDLRDFIISFPHPKVIFGSPMICKPEDCENLIWDKSELTGQGDLKFPWKRTHEEIYVLGEGFRCEHRKGSVLRHPLRPSWSKHPHAVTGLHPTEKPVPLMVDILECCPWEKIIDPTCGTGPTLQAAKSLGKRAIGIEIEEKYCEIAAKRLAQKVMQF